MILIGEMVPDLVTLYMAGGLAVEANRTILEYRPEMRDAVSAADTLPDTSTKTMTL